MTLIFFGVYFCGMCWCWLYASLLCRAQVWTHCICILLILHFEQIKLSHQDPSVILWCTCLPAEVQFPWLTKIRKKVDYRGHFVVGMPKYMALIKTSAKFWGMVSFGHQTKTGSKLPLCHEAIFIGVSMCSHRLINWLFNLAWAYLIIDRTKKKRPKYFENKLDVDVAHTS